MTQFVDHLVGNAEHIEVHDGVVAGAIDHVDHHGHEWLDRIAGDDDCARHHSLGLGRSTKKRPHVSGLVHLVDVGRKRT